MKAAITDHHYHDITNAERVLAEAGIDLVVGQCRSEDDAIAFGRDADAVINQHCPVTDRVLASWPRCRGVVHVTHELRFARKVASHVVFMDGGVIVEEGPPEQVLDAPREERTRSFVGSVAR